MNKAILSQLDRLPDELQAEIFDFIEFIINKYEKKMRKESPKAPVFGSCKGLFVIPEDFDEPLEDFKEYMSEP